MEKRKFTFMDVLAISVVILSFIYFFVVYFFKNVTADSNFTVQVVTAVIAMDMLVLSYYFGNSKASANKDATILQQAQSANNPQPVQAETVNTDNVEQVNANSVTVK